MVAESLAVATDEDTFETSSKGNGFVYLCVTLADSFAAEYLLSG